MLIKKMDIMMTRLIHYSGGFYVQDFRAPVKLHIIFAFDYGYYVTHQRWGIWQAEKSENLGQRNDMMKMSLKIVFMFNSNKMLTGETNEKTQ